METEAPPVDFGPDASPLRFRHSAGDEEPDLAARSLPGAPGDEQRVGIRLGELGPVSLGPEVQVLPAALGADADAPLPRPPDQRFDEGEERRLEPRRVGEHGIELAAPLDRWVIGIATL